MAKLKMTTAQGALDVDGYVSVAQNLVYNGERWIEFLDARPEERPALLQAAADADGGSHPIMQQTADGQLEQIDNTNCRIVGERDIRRRGERSRVTVPMPSAPQQSFDYLGDYARTIHDLYEQGQTDRAHKFMFAVMMLTRCR